MYIRPFTISGAAIVLLQLYLAGILLKLPVRGRSDGRHTNQQLAYVLVGYAMLSLHQHLLVISDASWFRWTQYLRNLEAMLVMAGAIRLFYMLIAAESDRFFNEYRKAKIGTLLLVVVEIAYTISRLLQGIQLGDFPTRPALMQLPIISIQIWLLFVAIRFLLFAERPDVESARLVDRLRQAFIVPQSDVGRFLRDTIVGVISSFIILFVFLLAQSAASSAWIMNLSDTVTIVITIIIVFAYLRLQLDLVGLQVRISVIGLALFLMGGSTLGWLIASVVLEQVAPGVPMQEIIGSISQTNFVIDAQYLFAIQQLHEILVPLLLFLVVGSVLFILGYRTYYHLYVAPSFNRLLNGIQRLESGDLAYQIVGKSEDEFGRIAGALNKMAQSLNSAESELAHYQANLEQTLETRTDQLQDEIEQRKDSELHTALQDERSRIARDAHDGILQNILALRARLRSRRIRHMEAQELGSELDELALEALESAHELRRLIQSTSTDWAEIPFVEALGLITTRFQKAYGIEIVLEIPPNLAPLHIAQHISILRVIQESLSNIGRHSQATHCEIKFTVSDDTPSELLLQICDNGVGIEDGHAEMGGGSGLKNMHARALALGGSFDIQPILNGPDGNMMGGTRIKMLTPLS